MELLGEGGTLGVLALPILLGEAVCARDGGGGGAVVGVAGALS